MIDASGVKVYASDEAKAAVPLRDIPARLLAGVQSAIRGARRTVLAIVSEALQGLVQGFTLADGRKVAGVTLESIAGALASGDPEKLLQLLPLEEMGEKLREVAGELEKVLDKAATSAHGLLPDGLDKVVKLEPVLDRVAVVAARQAADMVTAVTKETRAAIREQIARSVEGSISQEMTARELRSMIGLTRPQARALRAYIKDLKERAVLDNMSAERFQQLLDQRYARMIAARANVISRTELQDAGTRGQRELWQEGKDAGELDGYEREWVTMQRPNRVPCFCPELDGLRAEIGQPYEDERAGDGPTAHPNCECQERIVRKAKSKTLTFRPSAPDGVDDYGPITALRRAA